MDVLFSSTFKKQYKRADSSIKSIFQIKLNIFLQNRDNRQLRNHSLKGKHAGLRSINITGDWRALYREETENNQIIITFVLLGTHSQLYK